jgi:hypothetical protein
MDEKAQNRIKISFHTPGELSVVSDGIVCFRLVCYLFRGCYTFSPFRWT